MPIDGPNARTALVLSGGGAYGAYEVGVVKALCEGKSAATGNRPLDADILTGTSVGSFNAAVMAMDEGGALGSVKRLEKLWTEEIADNGVGRGNGVYRLRGNPKDYLDPHIPGSPLEQLRRAFNDASYLTRQAAPRVFEFFFSGGQITRRALGLIDISAMINTLAFQTLVERFVVPKSIRDSDKVLRVTATNWGNGEPQEFDFQQMTDEETWTAIRASAAIPGLFPMVEFGGEVFVDGGVVMNTPIRPAVEEHATELHVITLDPEIPHWPETRRTNTLDTFDRVYTAMLSSKITEDIETARWINEGIEIFERADSGQSVTGEQAERFMRVAARLYKQVTAEGRTYTPIEIHRYFPKKSLGGLMGMLNFHRDSIDDMIQRGYEDACAHSCKENGCVIPASAGKSMSA